MDPVEIIITRVIGPRTYRGIASLLYSYIMMLSGGSVSNFDMV